MAIGRAGAGKPTGPRGPTLAACLEEARSGRVAPVYLFDGDPFLTGRAARELAQLLVPEEQREFNVVELDPASSTAEVAAELQTRGLFAGAGSRKVVLVREPAFLVSKEDGSEAFKGAREKWTQGRQREGARRLMALAAKAGWRAEDLAEKKGPSATAWRTELGVELGPGDKEFVSEAARYALEREVKVPRSDAAALDVALGRGLPPGHVLLVAAGKIDGRLPLVKKLAGMGPRITFAIEKEGTWTNERLVLGPVLDALLSGSGKRCDAGAEERLAALVGEDARTLAGEVAKLVAFVGERATITAADVDLLVTRVAEDPFFALGNAIEARDLPQALSVLDRSLADGASPFMILGSMAGTVRRLLVEGDRGRKAAGGKRIASPREWESLVLPLIPEDELGKKKPFGFWLKYQAAQRYTRGALMKAIVDLAEVDLLMKRGADERPLLERALWRFIGGEGQHAPKL